VWIRPKETEKARKTARFMAWEMRGLAVLDRKSPVLWEFKVEDATFDTV
jgi:hypothetical protein